MLLALCSTNISYGQNGSKLIRKAQIKFEENKFKKALSYLNKAKKQNYGFCGNAWTDAYQRIDLLRAKIYLNQKKYDQARQTIDSMNLFSNSFEIDSLKIETYKQEFNIDTLTFTNLDSAEVNQKNGLTFIKIDLEKGGKITFMIYKYQMIKFATIDESKLVSLWTKKFRKSKTYKLIKENKQ